MLGNIYLTTRLRETRDAIENCDRDILRAVNKRAKLVADVQAIKAELGMPIIDPARERYLNRTLGRLNTGPLAEHEIVHLFETIRDYTMPKQL